MRLVLPAFFALVGFTTADFLIYSYTDNSVDGVNSQYQGYKFFDGPPSCNDVCVTSNLSGTDDASGRGVRCEGTDKAGSCLGADSSVLVLEVHIKDGMHWTIYADKGFEMMAADNSGSQGKCTPDTSDDYDCNCSPSKPGGRRMFSCKSGFVAKDFGLQVL